MRIIWSDTAKVSYEEIIDDLLEQWPIKIVYDFENLVNSMLDKLLKYNFLCPKTKMHNLRKCVIHKNISLVYRLGEETIELVSFVYNKSEHKY